LLVAESHGHAHGALALRPAWLLGVILKTEALRRPDRFEKFVLACEADARGRTGLENRDYPQADYLRGALSCLQAVSIDSSILQNDSGVEIGQAVAAARLAAITDYRKTHQPPK
jgi:tRNA nucleotidyltransferase (CCA-adding enzyme)